MSIVESRVGELIRDFGDDPQNPDFDRIRRDYKDRYGVGTTKNTLISAHRRWLAENNEVVAPQPQEVVVTATGEDFVPTRLLDNIGEISDTIRLAGGHDAALAVANVVEMVGGVGNFTRAVQLLRKVGGLPPTLDSGTDKR